MPTQAPSEDENLDDFPSLASLLGIKDSLRLRRDPIGIRQRPHIILKRVEESDTSSDDSDEPHSDTVQFRIYTAKHLNLKPGRELLLTVESLDEKFEDQLFTFEGTLDASSDSDDSDAENTTQVEEEPLIPDGEDDTVLPCATMPPKMRRREWMNKDPIAPVPVKQSAAYASAGVQTTQATPIHRCLASIAVQATPPMLSASTQATPSYVSSSVQARIETHSQSIQTTTVSSSTAPSSRFAKSQEPLSALTIDIPTSSPSVDDMEISPGDALEEDSLVKSSLLTFKSVKEEILDDDISYSSPINPTSENGSSSPLLPASSISHPISSPVPAVVSTLDSGPIFHRQHTALTGIPPTEPASLRHGFPPAKKIQIHPHPPPDAPPPLPKFSLMIPRGIQTKAKMKTKPEPEVTVTAVNIADAKEAIVISTGPYSNCLNIRPSSIHSRTTGPTTTASSLAASSSKKRLVINSTGPLSARVKKTANQEPNNVDCDNTTIDNSIDIGIESPSSSSSVPAASRWQRIEASREVIGENLRIKNKVSEPQSRPTVPRSMLLPEESSSRLTNDINASLLPQISPNGKKRKGENESERQVAFPQSESSSLSLKSGASLTHFVVCVLAQMICVVALKHPLPARPLDIPSLSTLEPSRVIKRERSPSPNIWTAPGIVRVHKRSRKASRSKRRNASPGRRRRESDCWTAPDVVRLQPAASTSARPIDVDLIPDPQPRRVKREESPSPGLPAPQDTCRKLKPSHTETLAGGPGVVKIVFNSDGSKTAVLCQDNTVRIWDCVAMTEIVCLSQFANAELAWLEKDLVSLSRDGVLRKLVKRERGWDRIPIVCVSPEQYSLDDELRLTVLGGRIAISCPRFGVNVWIWSKGSWVAQRSISRKNITALKFIEGGDALIGGTLEGVVWHCAVPNGMLKAYAFLPSKITSLSINPRCMQALASTADGPVCVVDLGPQQTRRLKYDYSSSSFDGQFASEGNVVICGSRQDCLAVWDAQKENLLVCEMEYGHDNLIQVVATCDGPRACVLAGTRDGQLLRWDTPKHHSSGSTVSVQKLGKFR
ncbi:hypothetical protein MIND_01003400 [Mycena indigotica]|uniref:Uncharacterized protein n=1 Tax=Mycena indigotica TaxID=2126181 RepID=A0A8H6S7W9_9AGAR|nr:uncharacterized protein MIND_01003400 [Mycena indigotica]KAF7294665.1 hypothetical protein MIND_01003400 [Mycena indigotica]